MPTRVATSLLVPPFANAADRLLQDLSTQLDGAQPALVLLFGSPAAPLAELAAAVTRGARGAAVLSASTAGEFTEMGDATGSVAAFALAGDFRVSAGMGTGLSRDVDAAVRDAVGPSPFRAGETHPHRTAIALVDPLAGVSDSATQALIRHLGNGVQIVGGAAGDDLQMQRTVVGVGEKLESNAIAVLTIESRTPFGVGVHHGHRPLSCALRVTRATGTRVHEIEGRPAWDVWLAHTRARAQSHGIYLDRLKREEEGAFLLRFEAALVAGDDSIIRAPLSREADGSIVFACAVPTGTILRITESGPDRQTAVALEAAREAKSALHGRPIAGALVFDCICRKLILADAFGGAIRAASDVLGGVRLAGFETYGEIAVAAPALRGFHNTTSVVVAIPR